MQDCFNELEKCNYHVTYVGPDGKTGGGMMIELGYAIKMNLPTLLILPERCWTISASSIVDNIIRYKSTDDLFSKLDDFFKKANI